MKKKIKGYYNYYGEFMSNRSMCLLNSAFIASGLLVLTTVVLYIANIDLPKYGLLIGYIYAGLVLLVFIGLVLMIKDKNNNDYNGNNKFNNKQNEN